jgi:hypothetical protein
VGAGFSLLLMKQAHLFFVAGRFDPHDHFRSVKTFHGAAVSLEDLVFDPP